MYLKTSFGKGCLLLKYHIWYICYNIACVLECLNHFKYLRPKVTNPKISVYLRVKTISLHCFFETRFFILTKHRLLIGSFFGYICLILQLSGYLHHSVLSYKSIHSWIFHWPKQPKIDMSKWCCTPYIRFHLILLICTSYNLGYDITWYCLIRLNDYNLTRQTAQRLFCKFVFYPTGNTSTIEI